MHPNTKRNLPRGLGRELWGTAGEGEETSMRISHDHDTLKKKSTLLFRVRNHWEV